MCSQLISLAWDGHHRTLVSVFGKLLESSHLVDCTVAAEGHRMKAHKEILSAFSPFFELLFSKETDKNPTVIISGIRFRDLRCLIDFMYQGKLEVTQDRIQDIIDAAECLQIKGLGGGHVENDSGNLNNNTVLNKRPALLSGIAHKQTREGECVKDACVDSEKMEVTKINCSNEIGLANSVVISCGTRQSPLVQNVMSDSDVQNVAIVSNISFMPAQSTKSENEMDLLLQGENVVKKEPDSDGDVNINEPMRDTSRIIHVLRNSGSSYENRSEESILGLSSDISVPSEKNVTEDLPLDCIPPGNVPESIGVPSSTDLQMNVVLTETENDCFGAAMGSISEPTYSPQQLSTAFVKIQRQGRNEATMGLTPGLPAAVNPHDASTPPRHSTPVRDRDLSGPIGRDVNDGRSSADMLLRCRICNRTFTHNRSFNAHMRIHADGLYPHEECDNATGTSIKLNEHQHNQSRRKLFKCSVCDFKSKHCTSLSVHIRSHRGLKPYKCTECGYTCANSWHLKRHQRIHSGEKPYKCTECDYTSNQCGNLKTHQQIHHSGLKPYKCSECNYAAARSSQLKVHQHTHRRLKS